MWRDRFLNDNNSKTNFIRIALIFMFLFISFFETVGDAHSQSGTIDDVEAQRHLEFAQEYELTGKWDQALDEYQIATRAESSNLALEAHKGIIRVLKKKTSFSAEIRRDLDAFFVWLTSGVIKLAVVFIVFLLLQRVIFYSIDRNRSWTIAPFFDLTGNDWGEAIASNIVAHMHKVRMLHISSSKGMFNVSEEIDLPSFGTSTYQESMLSSLKAMDSLDVSGIGLPIGSVLSSIMRWLDMGSNHISGTLQKQGQNLELSAQLHQGRRAGVSKIWSARTQTEQGELGSYLPDLEYELSLRILFYLQELWGASTPKSLELFTKGLRHLQIFQVHPTVQTENLEKAVDFFERALAIDPSYIAAMYNLAITYHILGKHQPAIDLLKRLRLRPDHGLELEIAYNLGVAYYHSLLGSWVYDLAEQEFNKVVQNLSEETSIELERELLALSHCGLTSVYAQKIHYKPEHAKSLRDLATKHYYKALRIAPYDPPIKAIAHVAMAMTLLNMGQVNESIVKFKKAVQLKPDYWRAYIHWGRAEMAAGNPEHAVLCIKQALALNPEYEFAQYQLGIAYKHLGKYEEAVKAFACAPGIAKAHDERGAILAEHYKNYKAALVEFERALDIKPDLSNALVNIAWYMLEAGYHDSEHLDRALQCAQRAIELDKDTANAWHRHAILGRVYLVRGQLSMARKELERSIQLNKAMPQSYFFLAKTLLDLGDLKAAKEALAEFLNRSSTSSWYNKTRETAIALIKEVSDQLKHSKHTQ